MRLVSCSGHPIELSVIMEIVTSHMWLLSTCNVASVTEGLNFLFCLNSHTWLSATVLNRTDLLIKGLHVGKKIMKKNVKAGKTK